MITQDALARQLLRRARIELDGADATSDPTMQFLHAHMAAIRTASAVLALLEVGPRRRRRMLSVWEQLAEADERWGARAAAFAAGAATRAAIEAGRLVTLDPEVARDAVLAAGDFVDEVASFAARLREPVTAAIAS